MPDVIHILHVRYDPNGNVFLIYYEKDETIKRSPSLRFITHTEELLSRQHHATFMPSRFVIENKPVTDEYIPHYPYGGVVLCAERIRTVRALIHLLLNTIYSDVDEMCFEDFHLRWAGWDDEEYTVAWERPIAEKEDWLDKGPLVAPAAAPPPAPPAAPRLAPLPLGPTLFGMTPLVMPPGRPDEEVGLLRVSFN